jgi:hypothetical protein
LQVAERFKERTMTQQLTAEHVLQDIEFELVQGAITRDDLGQGIQAVRQYQNKLRSEVFQPGQDMPQLREVTARQFQLNDMLITLLQETAAATQEMQLKTRRLADWQPALLPPPTASAALMPSTGAVTSSPTAVFPIPEPLPGRDESELFQAMNETLHVKLEMQPSNLPLLGSWLQRFKAEMHSLVLFYVRKVAERQTAVNRTFATWSLYFNTLHQQQQQEIRQLQARLAALEGREPPQPGADS